MIKDQIIKPLFTPYADQQSSDATLDFIPLAKRRQESRRAQAALEEEGNKDGLYWRGVELNHTAINYMQLRAIHGQKDDPSWRLTEDRLITDFKETGLPVEWMEHFEETASEAEYQKRLGVYQERHHHSQVLMAAGGRGIAAMLGSSLTDPITFAAEAALAPLAVIGKGSKVAKLARAALYGGGVGAAGGAMQNSVDPDYDWRNLLFDAAAGATINIALSARPILRSRDEAVQLQQGLNRFANTQSTPPADLTDIDTIRGGVIREVDDEFAKFREELAPLAGERPDARTRELTNTELRRLDSELADAEAHLKMADDAPGGVLDTATVKAWDDLGLAKGELKAAQLSRAGLLKQSQGLKKTKEDAATAKRLDGQIKALEARVLQLGKTAKKTLKPNKGRLNVRARMLAEDITQWGDLSDNPRVTKMREAAARQEVEPLRQRVANLKTQRDALQQQRGRWAQADDAHATLKKLDEAEAKPRTLNERIKDLPEAVSSKLGRSIDTAMKAEKSVLKRAGGDPGSAVYEKSARQLYSKPDVEKFADDSGGAARVAGTRVDTGLDTTFSENTNPDAREVIRQADEEGVGDIMDSVGSAFRIDLARAINTQPTAEGRILGRKLHSSSVGVKGEQSNFAGMVERAKRIVHIINSAWMPDFDRSYKAWAKSQGHNTLVNFRPELRREFNDRVFRYMNGFDETDANVIEAALRTGKGHMGDALNRAKTSGVSGVQDVNLGAHDRGYLPRRLKFDLRNLFDSKLGSTPEANLVIQNLYKQALINGFLKIGRDVDEVLSERVAKHMTDVAFGRKYPQGVKFQGQSKSDFLEDVLGDAGLDQTEIEDIIFRLTGKEAETPKASARFKSRLPMDMTVYTQMPDGTKLYLSDLYEDNVEALWDDYVRELSGHMGAAEVGFRDAQKLDDLIDTFHKEGKIDDSGLRAYKLMFRSAMGQPLEDNAYGTFARATRMVLDWNFLRVMASVGWSMMAETGRVVGAVGLRATFQQMPALRSITRDVLSGSLDANMAREMAAMFAPGTTIARSSIALRPDDLNLPGLTGSVLSKADAITQAAKRAQVLLSGLGPMNDVQQRFFANSWLQRVANEALGSGISPALKARLRDYGMDNATINQLQDHLKTSATFSGGTISSIGADAMNPRLLDQYSNMMSRAGRHIIQDLDVGHVPAWTHSMLGRVAVQFRTFTVGAYTRALLHGLSMRDAQAVTMFLGGFAAASMGYVGRVYANYPHDEQRRAELLSPERMAINVMNMTSEGTFGMMALDTMRTLFGSDPLVNQRGTGLASNFFVGNPTIDLMNDITRTAKVPARIVRDDKEMTQEDLKAMIGMIYMNRLPGVLGAFNWFVDDVAELPREHESINNRNQ